MQLIIGIPTYNRPDSLNRRLNELLKFRSFIDGVIITDNSQKINKSAEALCEQIDNWIYIHNKTNIGGGANFIRLVEEVTIGTHLWWRGDDDPISELQIEAVQKYRNVKGEILILNSKIKKKIECNNFLEFSNAFEYAKNMGWLSSVIIPIHIAKEAISYGYWGVHTGWAHIALILGIYKINNNTRCLIIPYIEKKEDFRELGREGQRWALFNTCIKNFYRLSYLIEDKNDRKVFLKNWRKSQNLRYLKSLIRIKVGLAKKENLDFSTFSPLLSIYNLKQVLLFIILYLVSKTPVFILQMGVSLWSLRKDNNALIELELKELSNKKGFIKRYNYLRKLNKSKENVEAFI